MPDPLEFAEMFREVYVDTVYFDALVSDAQGIVPPWGLFPVACWSGPGYITPVYPSVHVG